MTCRLICICSGLTLATAVLSGCAVGPDFKTPETPATERYTDAALPRETVAAAAVGEVMPGGHAQKFLEGEKPPADWWKLFGSPQLDGWVEQALAGNPSVAQAQARLREATERYDAQSGSTRFPAVDAGVSAARQQVDFESMGITAMPSPPPFTLYNASITVTYTFDWFGANARTLEGLQAAAEMAYHQLQSARLTLAGNVTTATLRLAAAQDGIEAVTAMAATQRAQLSLLEKRLAMGGVSALDVQSLKSALAATEARLPPLQRQRYNLRHQLAAYLGSAPAEHQFPDLSLAALQLPADIPVTLPSEWVRRRPDIRAAEALLHQASADVGVATANLYPRLTLSGSFGSDALKGEKLFADGFNLWSLGAGITQPLFHGGALRAQKRAAEAAFDAAAAGYRQTLLQGFQNVADALRALETDARALQARRDATREAEATYRIMKARHEAGGVDQWTVLDAERLYHQAMLDEIQARADRYADTAALFQAMGAE